MLQFKVNSVLPVSFFHFCCCRVSSTSSLQNRSNERRTSKDESGGALQLLSSMRALETVSLSHNTALSGVCLLALPPRLASLNLDFCRHMDAATLAAAFQHLVSLRRVSFYRFTSGGFLRGDQGALGEDGFDPVLRRGPGEGMFWTGGMTTYICHGGSPAPPPRPFSARKAGQLFQLQQTEWRLSAPPASVPGEHRPKFLRLPHKRPHHRLP